MPFQRYSVNGSISSFLGWAVEFSAGGNAIGRLKILSSWSQEGVPLRSRSREPFSFSHWRCRRSISWGSAEKAGSEIESNNIGTKYRCMVFMGIGSG